MLNFEMDVLVADLNARTIEGVIVPYGEVGTIQGRDYRFAPGSARLVRRRTPLLVDHDRGQPIGVLDELIEGRAGALARFRIDATPAGDEALTQAASGSRGSLSVGAEVVRFSIDPAGVTDVLSADVHEVSLLALGAFESAAVTRVAAEADDPEPEEELGQGGSEAEPEEGEEAEPAEPVPGQEELELDPEPEQDDAGAAGDDDPEGGDTMTTEASAAPVLIQAERAPRRELLAGEYVRHMIQAASGDRESARFLEAAAVESISTDVAGLLPPTYERTVIGRKAVTRPLYVTFRSRPLPGVGLLVNKPKWTTHPDGTWAADVNADATSTKVVIGSQTADVIRWDWAGAIPWVVVQRSDPSIVDEIYGEAVEDFYLDVEAKIAGELLAGQPGVATTLGAGIAEFFVATGNERAPDVIIMAPDVWGTFADAGALTVPLAQGGVDVGAEGLVMSFAGIPAVTSGAIAPGSAILATRRAVDARVTEPVRLTANAIGALNVELAVVGEALFDTDYPRELLILAGVTPAGASGGAARSSRSSS